MRENLGEPTLDWVIQETSFFVNNTDFTKMFLRETLHNIQFYWYTHWEVTFKMRFREWKWAIYMKKECKSEQG